jgi:hypothetical protein
MSAVPSPTNAASFTTLPLLDTSRRTAEYQRVLIPPSRLRRPTFPLLVGALQAGRPFAR